MDKTAEACAADNEVLRAELEATREDLLCAIEAYESLERIHEEVCAECNELSEACAILKQDLDDASDEFESLSADYAVAFDVLAEHGLIDKVEVEDYKNDEESLVVPFEIVTDKDVESN